MLPVPAPLQVNYEAYVRAGKIPETAHASYRKWLRFYLDFCQKYHDAPARRESQNLFLKKLPASDYRVAAPCRVNGRQGGHNRGTSGFCHAGLLP